MSRHQRRPRPRRANTRREPVPAALARAVRCPDCLSSAVIVQTGPRRYETDVYHDPDCPWLAGLERAQAADRAARKDEP